MIHKYDDDLELFAI